ncbi:N-lysine methyltransferase SMYD2-B-like [Chironomus tepperi]|uniref:N-lysine methyltransferase SMYD2-B-like n=1 Tax=Chironomus tepperi TaxID=113505 RepID=UPI00391F101A
MAALIAYNKSIAYACTKNALSLSYANRSATFLELECYDECLKNIKWARESGYPENKLSKLDEREQKCKKLRLKGRNNKNEDPWEFFKLSYPANKKIPFIVDRLEVRTTEKYGRGIYATRDLKAGDIICIEDPVISFLDGNHFYKHCNNCSKSCMLNLIPCNNTASMMFCSTKCMENFYSKYENILLSLNDDMKLLSEIATPFGGYKELDDFINKTNTKNLKKTIFDFDLSDPQHPEYRKNLMTCVLSLQPKANHHVNEDKVIFNHVSKKTANHILSIVPNNCSGTYYLDGEPSVPIVAGSKISLFKALINHSCVRNIQMVGIDDKIAIVVMKPVKAGEQIFDCYYDKYSFTHDENRDQMMKQFNFKCDCHECFYNSFNLSLSVTSYPCLFMTRKNFTTAREVLKNNWNYINSNKNPQKNFDKELMNTLTLCTLGYYATFPCENDSHSIFPFM